MVIGCSSPSSQVGKGTINIMSSSDPFEEAINRMRVLVNNNIVKQLQGANEAKTRLLIVDEILNILGWPKSDTGGEVEERLDLIH